LGPSPVIRTVDTSLKQVADAIFEPRLRELDLATDQIENQNSDGLQESLDRVNDAIQHPEAFGQVNVRFSPDVGGMIVARNASEGQLTVGILPILLERKRLILSRIRQLSGKDAEDLMERLATQPNGAGETAEKAAEALRKLRVALEADTETVDLDRDVARRREQVAIYERQAKVWQSFLALARPWSQPDCRDVRRHNCFPGRHQRILIILGDFFGQSVGRDRTEREEGGGES
jgi:hypothetical protein